MKKFFFMLGFLGIASCSACQPAEVELNNKTDSGSAAAPSPPLEPVGVIAADDCQHIDIGDKACNFRLTDQNGETWDLYSYTGDVIMLDFSTSWCGPCQNAAAHTQALQDEFTDNGVQVVTILIDGPNPSVEPSTYDIDTWVSAHNITNAPVLQGSRDKMLDGTGTGIEGYIIGGFPTYLYIGRDMKFYAGHVGFSEEYVRQKIEEGL
jgi:thiol-disulfide isomerase/thioredoxin